AELARCRLAAVGLPPAIDVGNVILCATCLGEDLTEQRKARAHFLEEALAFVEEIVARPQAHPMVSPLVSAHAAPVHVAGDDGRLLHGPFLDFSQWPAGVDGHAIAVSAAAVEGIRDGSFVVSPGPPLAITALSR